MVAPRGCCAEEKVWAVAVRLCPLSTKHSWSLRSEGVVIDGVHLKGENKVKCSLVKGTFKECKACSKCEGLTPSME